MVSNIVIVSGIAIAAVLAGGIGSYYYFVTNQVDKETATPKVDSSKNDGRGPRVIAPSGTLTAEWWKWTFSIPKETNPVTDTTGEFCDVGQSGPVWYLAGSFGGPTERSCNIPMGKSILIPIINTECSVAEYPELTTEQELRECALAANAGVNELMFTINGTTVDEAELRESYRIQSPLFSLTFPENNVFELPPATTNAISDGWWVMVEDLETGNYDIHFRGASIDPTGVNNFTTEVTYHIIVG